MSSRRRSRTDQLIPSPCLADSVRTTACGGHYGASVPDDNVLHGAMRALAAQLRASLDGTSAVSDRLSKGELREADVQRALRPHLHGRYDMCKGIVVNSRGEQSDPQDIIIVDSHAGPSLYESGGGQRVVPVETVVGVIQVKSRATVAEIESAVANVASAKRLLSTSPRYGHPIGNADRPGTFESSATFFGGIVCLSRPGTRDEDLTEAFARRCLTGPARERADALLVVDHFCLVWGNSSKGAGLHFGFRAEEAEVPLALLTERDSVLPFYVSLIEHLSHWVSPPMDWVDYAFMPPPSDLRYSYWYDEHAETPGGALGAADQPGPNDG